MPLFYVTAAPCPEDSKAVVPERGCTGPSLRPALLPLHGQCGRGAFCSTRIPSEKGKCCIKKRRKYCIAYCVTSAHSHVIPSF